MSTVYRGHIFHINGSPSVADARDHLVSLPDGALVVSDAGTIEWIGAAAELPPTFAGAPVVDNRDGYIVPGFVDAHVHFPQTYSTDSYGGGQLLEWLDHCIFPAESRLADPQFAERIARDFTRRRVAAGTTAAMVFGSAFPHAQDALFRATREAGLRVVSGRGIQTVGPESANALIIGDAEALALVRDEISTWHAVDTGDATTARIQVAVVPRFSLSVTRETLRSLGELYDEVRGSGVYFHTHLSENDSAVGGEIAAVKAVYEVESYL
uniref:amidohydrolase family protein n=1 Tax=Agreia sp. TaxID=1872416 RepID=UPI0035BBE75C